MKKITDFLMLAGIALLFASCSNISSDNTVTEGYTNATTKTKTLKINATSDDATLVFPKVSSDSSRTILAPALDASSDMKFYLTKWDTLAKEAGADNQWSDLEELTFTAETGSTTTGTIDATFEVSVYRFILYAVPSTVTPTDKANAAEAAYFIGYASADLRYADEITFYLTSENVKGSAGVELKLYSSNTKKTDELWKVPAGYKVHASIRDKNTDAVVQSSGASSARDIIYLLGTSATTNLTAETSLNGSTTAEFKQESVPAGTYNFEIAFVDTKNSDMTYYYDEEIIVLPNQKITADVFIPDVLEKVPEQPSSFFVAYADPLSKADDYYYAQFAWSDNSDNERSFEIQLMNISDKLDNTKYTTTTNFKNYAVPTSDETWKGLWQKFYTGTYNADDDSQNEGIIIYDWKTYQTSQYNPDPETYSLIKNNKTAMLLLPLGERYVARIKAVNDIGSSKWAYVVIGDQDTSHGDTTTSGTAAATTGALSTVSSKHTCTQTILLMDGTTYKATTAEIPVTPANPKFGSATGGLNLKMTLFPADVTTGSLSYTVAINRFRITYQLGEGGFYNVYDKSTYSSNAGYGAPSTFTAKPATVTYHTQTIGAAPSAAGSSSSAVVTMNSIAILAPLGLNQTYYKASSALSSDLAAADYIYLVADKQLFSRWLVESETDSGALTTATPTAGNRYPYTETPITTFNTTTREFEATFAPTEPYKYNKPDSYNGHTNLELFACYAVDTTLKVETADYTAYEWVGYGDVITPAAGSTPAVTAITSDISLVGTSGAASATPVYFSAYLDGSTDKTLCQKGDYVKISVSESPKITFTVNTSAKGYNTVALQIRRTSSSSYNYNNKITLDPAANYDTTSAPGAWAAAPAHWDVNIKSWKSGVYECTIIGSSKKYPNKVYTFPVTIYLVD